MQLLEPKTSIRRELIPGLLGPVAVSMLVVASWLYFDSNRDAHDRRVALVQNLVATFSRDFYAIGAMQDQEMAYEMASRLSAFPSLWHLEVVRADGESVFVYRNTPEDIQLHQLHPTDLARLDTDKPGQKSTRPLLASTRVVEHESALVVEEPIYASGTVWGHAHVVTSPPMGLRLLDFVIPIAIVLAWMMTIALFWEHWITRRLISPVRRISDLLTNVIASRDYTQRGRQDLTNEIGTLQQGLNILLAGAEAYERELQTSNSLLRQEQELVTRIIDAAPFGMALYDGSLQFLFGNAVLHQLTGRTTRQDPVDRSTLRQCAANPDKPIRLDRGGSERQVIELQLHLLETPGQYILTARDVTHAVHSERAKEARFRGEKMEAVARMAGNVAHDFNNLLTIILPLGTQIAETTEDPEIREDALAIRDASRHAAMLTRKLLQLTRTLSVQRQCLNVVPVVHRSVHFIRRSLPQNQEVSEEICGEGIWTNGDETTLAQVILNLVMNAKDAIRENEYGTITVRVSEEDLLDQHDSRLGASVPGRKCVITVRDNGSGIGPEHIRTVFDPYFTTKATGTGMGLAMVQAMISQLGGHVSVESELGVGSTFTVVLPAVKPPEAAEVAKTPQSAGQSGQKHILLVDDDAGVLRVVARALRAAGSQVTAIQDPELAVEVLVRDGEMFDFIVSDVRMPGLSGPEMVDRARQEGAPDLPFLFLSGYIDDETAKALQVPPEHLMLKPFRNEDLLERIRYLSA